MNGNFSLKFKNATNVNNSSKLLLQIQIFLKE